MNWRTGVPDAVNPHTLGQLPDVLSGLSELGAQAHLPVNHRQRDPNPQTCNSTHQRRVWLVIGIASLLMSLDAEAVGGVDLAAVVAAATVALAFRRTGHPL